VDQRLTAASAGLLTAQGPQALEQATAELVGAELYQAVCDEQTGLRFDMWAMELVGHAAQGSSGCPNGPHCSRKYSMILLACS